MNRPVSKNLLDNLRQPLMQHLPFSQMDAAHVDEFISQCKEGYFAPEELIIGPAHGPVKQLYCIRQGSVTGTRGIAEANGGAIEMETGDLFPVSALIGQRSVTATYRANTDTFCLVAPAAAVNALAQKSTAFAEFLNTRALAFLEQSRKLIQQAYASQAFAEQSLEMQLGQINRKTPFTVPVGTPIREALQIMHDRKIGSMLVVDDEGDLNGILTRSDVIGKIVLRNVDLDMPIERVMNRPVHALTVHNTAHDAALFMTRHNIRHVPVLDDGRLVNIISERDLFSNQRLSMRSVAGAIQSAPDENSLQVCAADIRRFARTLLGQGIRARQLTELISQLNDLLTNRLIHLVAQRHGVDLLRCSWIALGSEGRGEQTIATDQDNALVFVSDKPDEDRPAWLAFAKDVNEALNRCGYPLCKGNIMASNPNCCLSRDEWLRRFSRWIDQGSPEGLLSASIFFDFRHLAGNEDVLTGLRTFVRERAAQTPRFIKLLADNALRVRVPLNWRGAVDTKPVDGKDAIDLKMQGTALVVDTARIYALARGLDAISTRERLHKVGEVLGATQQETEGWITAFEHLQMMRLTLQMDDRGLAGNPNLADFKAMNYVDRRVLRISLRAINGLQQRLELDFPR